MNKQIIAAFYLAALSLASTASANVECLSGSEARNAFVADQSEPYFSLLQPREMAAKTGMSLLNESLPQQRERVRATYSKAVLDCTADDRKGLEAYLSIITSSLKSTYPGLVALPWRFVKIRDEIEGGLPHTRGNVIVLSESLLKSISTSAQLSQWQLDIMMILVHEQVHVIQRAEPKVYAAFYEQQWGFKRSSTIEGAGVWLTNHQIVNPDGIDVQWVWPVPGTSRVIWPRVILAGESAKPAMPDDFRLVGIELITTKDGYAVSTDSKGTPLYQSLSDEPAYMEKFAGINSLYHPNEIMADYLSELAVWDSLVDKRMVPPEQQVSIENKLKTIRKWAMLRYGNKN